MLVYVRPICSYKFTCCHTEIEVADHTFYLTQPQYTDTGPTSPSPDPIMPDAWQGSHWRANFAVTQESNPGSSALKTNALNTGPTSQRWGGAGRGSKTKDKKSLKKEVCMLTGSRQANDEQEYQTELKSSSFLFYISQVVPEMGGSLVSVSTGMGQPNSSVKHKPLYNIPSLLGEWERMHRGDGGLSLQGWFRLDVVALHV